MDDAQLERLIRRAGYDIRSENESGTGATGIYALRDGKRHTRSQPNLLALAEHLGCVEKAVQFIDDRDALDKVIAEHAQERNHFVVRRAACRVAIYRRYKYVQLVSAEGHAPAMYELGTDGLRRTSNGNLPPEVVAAFRAQPVRAWDGETV
jgi:hypothetical protein